MLFASHFILNRLVKFVMIESLFSPQTGKLVLEILHVIAGSGCRTRGRVERGCNPFSEKLKMLGIIQSKYLIVFMIHILLIFLVCHVPPSLRRYPR